MFGFFKKLKEQRNCEHEYKGIKMNQITAKIKGDHIYTHIFHDVKCIKCDKKKWGVSTKWVLKNMDGYMNCSAGKFSDDMVIEGSLGKFNLDNTRKKRKTYIDGKEVKKNIKGSAEDEKIL